MQGDALVYIGAEVKQQADYLNLPVVHGDAEQPTAGGGEFVQNGGIVTNLFTNARHVGQSDGGADRHLRAVIEQPSGDQGKPAGVIIARIDGNCGTV